MNKQLFKKYRSKLVWEGVINALIFGLVTAFATSILPALIILLVNKQGLWLSLMNYDGLWLIIAIGIISAAVATALFYFLLFRPTTKQIASRIDRQLSLDERMITMLELENDESLIAMRQREDSKSALSANKRPFKFLFVFASIVALAILAVCSSSLIAGAAVSFNSRIPWIHPDDRPSKYQEGDLIPVSYEAQEGGYIDGSTFQLVLFGENAETVVAIAEDGYAFVSWSDGSEAAERTDKNIRNEIDVYAMFAPLQDGNEGDGEPDENDGESDRDSDSDNTQGGGRYQEVNMVFDDQTHYRDVYQQYYEQAMKLLSEEKDVSDELRAFIETYFGIII